jgi:hypothetical protein
MLDRRAAVHHDRQTGVMRDPRCLPVDHPELHPERLRPDLDRLASMGHDELRPAEDVDDVDGAGCVDRLPERPEGRHAEDVAFLGVDRDEVIALVEQVAEDAEGRPAGVR